jgi:hypothetical protein
MNTLLKNKKLIIILALILLIVLWIFLRGRGAGQAPTTSPPPTPANSWEGLLPGASLFEDVGNSLGEPIEAKGDLYEYISKNPNINNEVLFEKGVAVLIKRIIVIKDQIHARAVFDEHGEGYITLYSERSGYGDNLYVYLGKGIAFIGNPIDNSVLEIWYFKKVGSIDEFIARYATGYTLHPDPDEQINF